MMKTECSIVQDLLPLYVEDMVNEETAQFVREHLSECTECRAEYEALKAGSPLPDLEKKPVTDEEQARSFKNVMKKMNRQFNSLAYVLIILFIFLGFTWTAGENMMNNSIIMPLVGVFGYYVFRWRAVYKIPILLAAIELFIFIFRLWDLDLFSAVMWTCIYSGFVFVGMAIAFLLHYAVRKEES